MLLTSHIAESKTVPCWNQVKDLSDEDKVLLIAKLSSSIVAESRENLDEQEAEKISHAFPEDLMQQVVEYASAESKAGKSIPHSQVKNLVLERLGWK